MSCEHAGNGESEGTFKFGAYWDEVGTDRIYDQAEALACPMIADRMRS